MKNGPRAAVSRRNSKGGAQQVVFGSMLLQRASLTPPALTAFGPTPAGRSVRVLLLIFIVAMCGACNDSSSAGGAVGEATQESGAGVEVPSATIAASPTTPRVAMSPTAVPTPLPIVEPTVTLVGTVVSNGKPLASTTVTLGARTVSTDDGGMFVFVNATPGTVVASRPAWEPTEVSWDGATVPLTVELDPIVVRGLRVSVYSELTDAVWDNLIALAGTSSVNALVFDTKDESGHVRYETNVALANEINAVLPMYDPVQRIAQAREAGLYTITRIVSFEDPIRANARPSSRATGKWIDAANSDNWGYNLDLAEEACALGFDEIQFDYVRFPTGVGQYGRPATQAERVGYIVDYLTRARDILHPMGCALSADIFGIVLSSADDQGIGQVPEDLSTVVDALSPMVYPSHYGSGWLGLANPNNHNALVTADALDDGSSRLVGNAVMRPWLQAFYYNASEIRAGIDVADERGMGWLLWEAGGSYSAASLPPAPVVDADGTALNTQVPSIDDADE